MFKFRGQTKSGEWVVGMRFGKIETLEAELARIDNSNVAIIEQEMPGILDNPDLFFPVMTMMSKARGDEYRFHTSTTKQLTG